MRIQNRPGELYPQTNLSIDRTAAVRTGTSSAGPEDTERSEGVVHEPSSQLESLRKLLQATDEIRGERVEAAAQRLEGRQYDGPEAARATAEAILRADRQ
jgi:hypothetical protein